MKKLAAISLSIPLSAFCFLFSALAQTRDFTRFVNPFIGTGGHGHTFPGATLPFGMVQLSPDTRNDNWDGSSGYHYSDDVIYGFSHTHLSGTGIPDGSDILFMPAISEYEGPKNSFGLYTSRFLHSDEVAGPGYYSVKLDDRKVFAEMTATSRVGFHRYTFPASRKAGVNLDLNWRDRLLDGDFKIFGKRRIEGFRRSSSWAKNQTVYFVAEFSRSFDEIALGSTRDELRSAFFAFAPKSGEQVLLKVAISYVSIEGARKNLEAELPAWDFDKVRADAKAAWNKELSKIEVSGGTDDQTKTFYTALYHTMIHPSVFNDVDGQYKGHDGKVHVLSPGFSRPAPKGSPPKAGTQNAPRTTNPKSKIKDPKSEQYTVFSLWDTFRAAHPLYTIIDQKRTVDFI
ncbi:MAG: glycoside hydrolase domain-containing protein, partial [Acidobacteriota bacterium]